MKRNKQNSKALRANGKRHGASKYAEKVRAGRQMYGLHQAEAMSDWSDHASDDDYMNGRM